MIETTTNATDLSPDNRAALVDLLYQLADDELVVGHRSSEWLGLAPDIEEDVAFASLAQDEVGHATFFYGLLEQLGVGDADFLAFDRAVDHRRNARFVEAENGDWAENVARRYFYEVFEQVRLKALVSSFYEPLVQGASKMLREEYYHLLHTQTWFQRLAMADGEARKRLDAAIHRLWPVVGDLFDAGSHSDVLISSGLYPRDHAALIHDWTSVLRPVFGEVRLDWPGEVPRAAPSGRRGQHTPALARILDIMGEVHRTDPAAKW